MRLENTSNHKTYDFPKKDGKVKNGVIETVSIAPREEADLDVDPNDATLKAALVFGELRASDKVVAKAAESMAAPAAAPSRGRG
jgi:hypothetical protein